jgi:hypothetical protein
MLMACCICKYMCNYLELFEVLTMFPLCVPTIYLQLSMCL